jgi:hypothetical protein
MLRAAFMSRSCTVPQAAQIQVRTDSGFGPSRVPHAQQIWDVGTNRPIRWNPRP